jgi:tRNA nucleotidyltransferase (CCA-adding enzyme)
MFAVLRECGALGRIMPQLDALLADAGAGSAALHALDTAADAEAVLEVRFAALMRALDPLAVQALSDRLRVPAACRDLALLAARHAHVIADAAGIDAETMHAILEAADAFRRPERFAELVLAALAGEAGAEPARVRLMRALGAAAAVDAGAIAKASAGSDAIGERVSAARLEAVRKALNKSI